MKVLSKSLMAVLALTALIVQSQAHAVNLFEKEIHTNCSANGYNLIPGAGDLGPVTGIHIVKIGVKHMSLMDKLYLTMRDIEPRALYRMDLQTASKTVSLYASESKERYARGLARDLMAAGTITYSGPCFATVLIDGRDIPAFRKAEPFHQWDAVPEDRLAGDLSGPN